jgi:hypothetical protein
MIFSIFIVSMAARKDWILAALGFIAQQVMILDSASRKDEALVAR